MVTLETFSPFGVCGQGLGPEGCPLRPRAGVVDGGNHVCTGVCGKRQRWGASEEGGRRGGLTGAHRQGQSFWMSMIRRKKGFKENPEMPRKISASRYDVRRTSMEARRSWMMNRAGLRAGPDREGGLR